MASLVEKVEIKRTPGYLYFVDGDGDVSRTKMRGSGKKEKVKKTKLKRESGYLYYLKADGVYRSPMKRR